MACGGPTDSNEGGTDASVDAPSDASNDVAADTGIDAKMGCMACPKIFVVRKMFLGDSDRSFVVSTTAWKQFGIDIDGKTTTSQSTDVCKRVLGAPAAFQVDGNNGIDNSFGANFVPIIQSAGSLPALSKPASDAIEKGSSSSFAFRLDGLGTMQDYAMLPGSAYVVIPPGTQPTWMGSDAWGPSSRSVSMNDVSKPLAVFPNGSMAARAYDSKSSQGPAVLGLTIGPFVMMLPVRKLFVQATIAADNSTATGVIAAVMNTEEFIAALKVTVGYVSKSLCGAAFDGIAQQIRQTSDILDDGTQDPMQTCNGISVGLGFDAAPAVLDGVVPDPQPPNPCP
jgi:hypothetical protein